MWPLSDGTCFNASTCAFELNGTPECVDWAQIDSGERPVLLVDRTGGDRE